MKARKLVESASLGPQALNVAFQAFDAGWAEIAGNYGSDPLAIEAARLKLANAILSVIDDNSRDPVALMNAALQVVAQDYRLKTRETRHKDEG